jgi:hypothetical protein
MTTNRSIAVVLFLALFSVYNANGREIASYDSQPAKFAARELLTRGTITLNYVVGTTPQLLERAAFVATTDGNYRSAYSPVPVLLAAAITWPLYAAGLINPDAEMAAPLIAKLGASALTAAAVALLFLAAARFAPPRRALWIALGLGIGTGYWSTASQTLWQHESAALGLAIAVWAFTQTDPTVGSAALAGLGLGLAGTSRPQLAVAIAVLSLGLFARVPWRAAAIACAIVGVCATALIAVNIRWFGDPLGAAPMLEALHPAVHATERSFRVGIEGPAGLLVSPSRGLLVFSPIVLIAIAGFWRTFRMGPRSSVWWCTLAAICQFAFYGSYSVWWGGHTYGPRYMLDVLPLTVPAAAVWLGAVEMNMPLRVIASAAFAWSVLVAATGAFCYPNERWNTDPNDVDRNHHRLWELSDMQIVRCWERGPSPANFGLFDRTALHAPGS